MCGIAGIIAPGGDGRENARNLTAMLDRIEHRGPDNSGIWQTETGVHLGHRRLAVIDLDSRSNQPMHDPAGRYCLTFNGEIYNHHALRLELEDKGHSFSTRSDTEVLLAAYRQWGADCLTRLDGMFAFAIWDSEDESLFLARDRFGEKPLYYCRRDGLFLFASELKAILAHPGAPRKISPQGLRDYLELGYTLTSSCIVEDVRKLPPAHFMRVGPGGDIATRRYWDLTDLARLPKAQYSCREEAVEALAATMDNSLGGRLAADVPVGLFLSGGIDSSLILLAAKKMVQDGRLDTFSAGFSERGYSETEEAKRTARMIGTDHHEVQFDLDRLPEQLPHIVDAADEPFADSSLIPTYFLSGFTRKNVTVSLSGDGGDELFAGYETYMADRLYRRVGWLPKGLFRAADAMMGLVPASHAKVGLYYKLRAFLRGAATGSEDAAHWTWRRVNSDRQIERLVTDCRLLDSTAPSFHRISPILERTRGLSHLDRMQAIDMETWLPDDILVKLDRMTMAHSLEGRLPFLTEEMARFAFTLPEAMRISGKRKKILLRDYVRNNLDRETAYRKKAGFNSPVSHWFSTVLKQRFLALMEEPAVQSVIAPDPARKLLQEHVSRRDDHGYRLFSLHCLAEWLVNNPRVGL